VRVAARAAPSRDCESALARAGAGSCLRGGVRVERGAREREVTDRGFSLGIASGRCSGGAGCDR